MIRSKFTKKRVLSALTVISILAIAVSAFAYWTTSGSGSGSATAGNDAGVTVSGDPANGIYPGSDVTVTSTITNSSTTQAQHVNSLHVAISIDATHAGNGCDASWFTYKADSEATGASNPHTVALDTDIPASGSHTVDGKVFMANTTSNQDACKGATINLAYTVDNS